MTSTTNFEQMMADEIELLTRRVADLCPVNYLRPSTKPISSMPCMYTPQSHLPLTPPEHIQSYSGYMGVQLNSHQFSVNSQGMAPEKAAYDYAMDSYGRKQVRQPLHPMAQPYRHSQQQASYAGLPPPGITHPNGGYYGSSVGSGVLSIPTQRRLELPPLVDDYHRQEARKSEQQVAASSTEEKKVGGVSAHLDYEMDEMTEFLGTMCHRLVYPMTAGDRILPQFRKFVSQILASTRLPSSTILLGLVYLRERMLLPAIPTSRHDHVYRMLTISLLLASKFLDDNTFQNKSWSEVTGIPCSELNDLEKDWLRDIKWNLHIDPEGTKGFSQYKAMWDTWVRNNDTKAAVAPSLPPINTNIRQHRHSPSAFSPLYPSHQHFSVSHSGVIGDRSLQLPAPQQLPTPQHEYWWGSAENSPPSAPETGPTTPEGYSLGWPYGSQASIPRHQQTGFSRLPPLVPSWYHLQWPGAPPCGCGFCQKNDSYFMTGFAQSVTA